MGKIVKKLTIEEKPPQKVHEEAAKTHCPDAKSDSKSKTLSASIPDTQSASKEQEKTSKHSTIIKIREELSNTIKEAHRLLVGYGLEKLADEVVDITKKVVRNKFSVCVVGEFSHGKSTLINKLLGVEVLPTDTLPTTALLTRITPGVKSGMEIIDNKDKIIQRLPLDSNSWEGLTAFDENGEASDMGNRYFVKLTINNEWLNKTGIDIYDTPGANDGSKSRDLEISRALMLADGAVVCIDARKGIMMTQEAFIRDRLMSPKVPYIIIAVTHLDTIAIKNRDRVISSIFAKLKSMKANLPVVITNNVEMPSDRFTPMVGIEKLRSWLKAWRYSSERSERMNVWVATGVKHILATAIDALENQKQIIEAKGEERNKLIIEKQAAISALHDDWDKIQQEIDACCEECKNEFKRKLASEQSKIIESIKYRIRTVPNPAKWYEQHYRYEVSNKISVSIITLDNVVTENARNNLDKISRALSSKYKTALERDCNVWKHTPDSTSYVHQQGPQLTDIDKLQEQGNKLTAVAVIAGGLLAGLTFGVGGIIGTVGASTCARHLTQKKINNEVEKAREALVNLAEEDMASILGEATKDCEARISLIYSDIKRSVLSSESKWMEAQMDAISVAAKPMQESEEKAQERLSGMIQDLTDISDNFNKFIN